MPTKRNEWFCFAFSKATSSQAAEIDDGIAAILVERFNGRSIQELCAMGGITLDDFTQPPSGR